MIIWDLTLSYMTLHVIQVLTSPIPIDKFVMCHTSQLWNLICDVWETDCSFLVWFLYIHLFNSFSHAYTSGTIRHTRVTTDKWFTNPHPCQGWTQVNSIPIFLWDSGVKLRSTLFWHNALKLLTKSGV